MAPEALRPVSLAQQFSQMELLPKDALDMKASLQEMPALVKGYLRLNGYVGDGIFVDEECNCIDISIVVKSDQVADKYARRYQVKTDTE
jgi:putative hemolysin